MKADLKKIWSILTPRERRKSFAMMALVVLMAFSEMIGVISIMPFLSVLARPEVIHEIPALQWLYIQLAPEDERSFIVVLGFSSIALVVGSSVFKTFTLHSLNRFTFLLRHNISTRLLSRYLEQPYEFFLKHNPSELARNVLSEVDQLHGGLVKPLSQLIAHGSVVLAMVGLLFLYDPWVAVGASTVVTMLYGMIYVLVRKRLGTTGQLRQAENGARFKACNEVLGGIKDVKITGAVDTYHQTFSSASRGYSRHQSNAETLSQSPLYIVEAVGYTGLICLSLFLMQQSGDIAKVLPVLGLFGFAAYRILPSAQIMFRGLAQLKFSSAALDIIAKHHLLPSSSQLSAAPLSQPKQSIELRNVRFAYPTTPGKPVFDHFDLKIAVNTCVGIVGVSGAGKSTLMDLLLGLLHPQEGCLMIDNINVDQTNVSSWHRVIGYVPQHIYLADVSVAENIAFGIPKTEINMQAVQNAAEIAQIHGFITGTLPNGYSTHIGDRGVRLSGGQRQRLGIARALYRNPAVLFMDEATSALDNETEAAITDAIGNLSGSKTVVVIAHREASLRFCDHIHHLSAR